MRILVVEDDVGIADGLQANLQQRGYAVDWCDTVAHAWAAPGGLPAPDTPVLIMTARDEVQQRIAGLDLGADDYLVKPFDVDELEARLRALLRRAAGRSHPVIRHGALEIDPAAHTVLQAGVPVELSPREFAVLLVLLESRGRVQSRQQLEARLYNWQDAIESNALEVHIHHLRRKLGSTLIHTMRGVGYFIPRDEAA